MSPAQLTIRPLQAGDIPACARIMAENPLWQRYGVTPASALARLNQGFEQHASIDVAESAGDVVGFVWYVLRGAFARSGYIMLIGVDPARQSSGAGAALMTHAETVMFAEVKDVFLLVSDFNHAAQRFYNRIGYAQVGALPAYVLPDITELIFRKSRPA